MNGVDALKNVRLDAEARFSDSRGVEGAGVGEPVRLGLRAGGDGDERAGQQMARPRRWRRNERSVCCKHGVISSFGSHNLTEEHVAINTDPTAIGDFARAPVGPGEF